MNDKLKSQLGYTIDQTILIVAVIAILVTMIIGSVGWDLLSRAGGTKLSSHLRQFETANGQFYAKHSLWPHQCAAGPDSFGALISKDALDVSLMPGFDPDTDFENLLPSYEFPAGGGTVQHNFGSGGDITMDVQRFSEQDYLVIRMTSIPKAEFEEADEGIDGALNASEGRLQGTDNGSTYDLVYYANVVN
ncbi:MAG: hypothetical protein IM662_14295 [Phenylobacterium sp.]|uniref:hypothetical protein n=1 Tax=Phenylobacterium sp. TaxID=1871053 RepID=UPI0025E3E239|nr:hypothetical protein [Phenylobacterium sp.]MCA6254336.1 hypothetical protein [Phenylobacterium sp.]MCA6278901.1 hypothetical protein [Phenylobacterium sp.]MCA6294219.1 hypothetical protein [Phenylobacterium sp.]MCA6355223.1 hypothetical protein [Phenylobacterium sp.]